MRIVAGTARGRALQGPKGKGIRPTADRVRESLFNILGQWMTDLTVLDLYAGTGAFALEAISRGAARAVMVDQDREALQLCRENAKTLGFTDQVEVLGMPVARGTEQLGKRKAQFDVIFADPPYAAHVVEDILRHLTTHQLLKPDGVAVIEHEKQEDAPAEQGGLHRVDQRKFGNTLVSLYRFA